MIYYLISLHKFKRERIDIMQTIGIPRALLYYYDKDKWKYFFEYLNFNIVYSPLTNKEILDLGENKAIDESCLALKIFLGHVEYLKDKCDHILIPRLYSIKKHEQVCTNFNCLYDLVNNLFDISILNYNVDLFKNQTEKKGFLSMAEEFDISPLKINKAYQYALKKAKEKRLDKETKQKEFLNNKKIKILLAGHAYNLYDQFIGKSIVSFLEKNNITIIYSDRIDQLIIDTECKKLSTDIHWTHNKEIMASIHHYKNMVDGIIMLSSFPCGPDSLACELINRKVKDTPIMTLIFENTSSITGVETRLESFLDILIERRKSNEKNN